LPIIEQHENLVKLAVLYFSVGESCVHRVCPTQRAADGGESARFQALFVASSWFRQSGVVSSHPPAGNANRWALRDVIDTIPQNAQVTKGMSRASRRK